MRSKLNPKVVVVATLATGALIAGATFVTTRPQGMPGALARSSAVPASMPRQVSTIESSEALATLRALDSSMADLVEAVSPAVVHIRSENRPQGSPMGMMPSGGQGSGFVFRPDGWIMTNDHVVGGFDRVTVILGDGRELRGTVRRAPESDLALVKVEANNLPTLRLADSKQVRAGQMAVAIGSPFGLESTVTIGHVSAVGRTNVIPDSRTGDIRTYWDLIQTDAPINTGNSGGPLINIDGEVIGINSAILSPTGTNTGIGFAISSSQARLLAETLIEKGRVVRGFLGVSPVNLKQFEKTERKLEGGAVVEEVPSDSPAAAAGIRKGDVIVRIGDVAVLTELDLRNSMLRYAPGTTVDVQLIRGNERLTRSVTLGEPPRPQANARMAPERNLPDMRDFFGPNGPNLPDRPGENDAPGAPVRLGVGIQGIDASARTQFRIPNDVTGVVVTSVAPGSNAERLGMKVGDVLQQVGEDPVTSVESLTAAVAKLQSGDRVRIKYSRFGENTRETKFFEGRLR